jgi:N-acyl homoserine lactone hydrolase
MRLLATSSTSCRITQREERPWIVRRKADTDPESNRQNLLRIIALKERLPELIIVPAHDMRAFDAMSTLSSANSEAHRHQ